jgi:hypothetical protein
MGFRGKADSNEDRTTGTVGTSFIMTLNPLSANAIAIPAPIPLPAPVKMATGCLSFMNFHLLSARISGVFGDCFCLQRFKFTLPSRHLQLLIMKKMDSVSCFVGLPLSVVILSQIK